MFYLFCYINKGFFYKPTHHPRISSATRDSGSLESFLLSIFQHHMSNSIITFNGSTDFFIFIEAFPFFFNCVQVEYAFGLAVINDVLRRSSNRQINTESFFLAKYLIKNFHIIVRSKPQLIKLITSSFWWNIDRVNNNESIVSKMSVKHRNKTFSNRAMADHQDSSTDMIVNLFSTLLILAFQHFRIRQFTKNYYEIFMHILEFIN